LLSQKKHSFVNILGLALSFSCCVLTFLYVQNEFSVNTVFPDVARIFRVKSIWREEAMGLSMTTLAPVGPTLATAYPEVESQARLYLISATLHVGDQNFRKDVMVADSSVLSLFGFPLLAGDACTALIAPRSVVITDQLAQTIYGTTQVIGKTMRFDLPGGGQQEYIVTAVRKTLPYNSITNFRGDQDDLIVPFNRYGDFIGYDATRSWENRYLMTFLKISPRFSVDGLRNKLASFITTYAPEQYHKILQLGLEPVSDLYLNENNNHARRVSVLVAGVAAFILLIACINFVTLTTTRSISRAKEIAVRKVVGATRLQLIVQFFCESILISSLAALVCAPMTEASLSGFLRLFGKSAVLEQHWNFPTILFLLAISLSVGMLSGIYPSIFSASFKPVNALKGMLRFKGSTILLRSTLVVVQFGIATVLLIVVFGISRQITFMSQRDLGFPRENILAINSVPRAWNPAGLARMELMRDRLQGISGVKSASLSFDTPTYKAENAFSLHLPQMAGGQTLNLPYYIVDENFAQTYGLTMKEGRFFSHDHPSDSSGTVLNETAAKLLGVADPIGARVTGPDGQTITVIGVVKDFNFESMHMAIRPLAFVCVTGTPIYRCLSLRLAGGDLGDIIGRIRQEWQRLLPHAPFEFFFVEERIDQFYSSEQQLRNALGVGTGIAFFIACMGMYGLAISSVAYRTKEIGIRKVLGASVLGIAGSLSGQFLKFVLVANVLGWPLGYYLLDRWLSDFSSRADLGVPMYVAVGLVSLTIAQVTVGGQAIRAALANPVDTLRYE